MILILAAVFLTNHILTRYVFRRIIAPIDILVNAVHEIRDGNLAYRIKYERKDEFAAVCSDFNEMTQRLHDMVVRQQKDENNRKELIAGISHDLRTPLTSIKAYLEGIEEGIATSPQMQQKYLATIKSKANDFEYIINQLFLFSKLDIGDFPFHFEKLNVGSELARFIEGHEKEYYEKGVSVTLTENEEELNAEIDIVQFRNVLSNILENSVKYKTGDSAKVIVAYQKDGNDIVITLTDNGPGVSDEVLDSMFDVFFRSDVSRSEPSKGSGLGLAISKRIIERFGGKIRAENVNNGGLLIEIILPMIG
jgi:signal transduction histidine kinase